MSDLIFGLGMVAVIEGLVLALVPLSYYQEMLKMVSDMPEGTRRNLGLAVVAVGVGVIWVVRSAG